MLDVVVYSGQKASPSFNNASGVGRYLLRGQRGRVVLDVPWSGQPPYHVSAGSTTITGIPHVPYRVRYRIAGEQIRGCWMGIRGETLDELPYEDAGLGRLRVAACVSWLR